MPVHSQHTRSQPEQKQEPRGSSDLKLDFKRFISHHLPHFLFIESFLRICFEGMRLKNRLRAKKNELGSLLAVDIQGHQHEGFCIVLHCSSLII